MARELINPLPEGVGHTYIGEPVTPRQADSAVGVGSEYNQQLALRNLISALEQRRGEKIFGQIPGQKGSTQGEALGRPSPQELMLQMMGGAGRIKEPGVLAHLLALADKGVKERQAASVEQLRLARLPLQDLRKYVDEAVPGQIEKLMAAYGESKGEMKQLLEDNLQKLSKEGGRIGNVARAAVKGDIASLSKELNVPKADMERDVAREKQGFRVALAEAGKMAEEAGGRTVAGISQAAQQAAEGVLPGVEQRAKALGEGYKAASVQEILAQSDSKEEAIDIMRDQYGGRKQDIIRDFDEQITQLESQGLQNLMSRGLDRTTAESVTSGKVKRLRAQKQSALNQVTEMATQAKLQVTNMWNQGKAAARQMYETGRLGAEQATGRDIGQIASNFAGQGLSGTTQAGLTGLGGAISRGGQLAQGEIGLGTEGLRALTSLTGQKMAGIGQGYGNLMDLSRQLAGQEFGAQTAGRQQLGDIIARLGSQGLGAQQQGDIARAGQLANVTQAQSGLEERVEHQGMDPALWLNLAEKLGVGSQQGPAIAGGMMPGMWGGEEWPDFPGGDGGGDPPPKKEPAFRDIINRIEIGLGGLGGKIGDVITSGTGPGTVLDQVTDLITGFKDDPEKLQKLMIEIYESGQGKKPPWWPGPWGGGGQGGGGQGGGGQGGGGQGGGGQGGGTQPPIDTKPPANDTDEEGVSTKDEEEEDEDVDTQTPQEKANEAAAAEKLDAAKQQEGSAIDDIRKIWGGHIQDKIEEERQNAAGREGIPGAPGAPGPQGQPQVQPQPGLREMADQVQQPQVQQPQVQQPQVQQPQVQQPQVAAQGQPQVQPGAAAPAPALGVGGDPGLVGVGGVGGQTVTDIGGGVQPQLTYQDLVNYQGDLSHGRPNTSQGEFNDMLNQFNQQNAGRPVTVSPNASQTPSVTDIRATPANPTGSVYTQQFNQRFGMNPPSLDQMTPEQLNWYPGKT